MKNMKIMNELLLDNDFRQIELEFRLGLLIGGKFTPNIPKVLWDKIKKSMKGVPVEQIIIDKYTKTNDPSISLRFVSKNSGIEYWEQKKKVFNETAIEGEFAVRSSVALEDRTQDYPQYLTPPGETNGKFIMHRKKFRTTYKHGPWNIDFTKVEQIPSPDINTEHTFEIEIELNDNYIFFEKELENIFEEGRKVAKDILTR